MRLSLTKPRACFLWANGTKRGKLSKGDYENVLLNKCLLDLAFEYVMPEHIIHHMPAQVPPDQLPASNRIIACAPQKPISKTECLVQHSAKLDETNKYTCCLL